MSSSASSPFSSASDSSPWDPFTQSFTLKMGDGTPFNVTLSELDSFNFYNLRTSINYASQLGASLILLVVLLLLTRADKRRSPIFILNAVSLALNFIRNVLQCVYFTSHFSAVYAFFANDYSRVPRRDYANSVAADVLTVMLLICVEVSLVLQTQVICTTLKTVYRRVLLLVSVVVSLVAIAFRLFLSIQNTKAILLAQVFLPYVWLASATNITTTISVCFFSVVFTTKLGFALNERRKMKLRQYGPMKIIFIGGYQTMVIPALFAILQYPFPTTAELSTNVLTLVAILLPLSSMWAASSLIESPSTSASEPSDSRRKLFGSWASTNQTDSQNGSSRAYSYSERKDHQNRLSPKETWNFTDARRSPTEIEQMDLERGVRVQRTFSVNSGRH
ncbi:MAG: hypothetical protein M1824_004339 [Vezdaea acicularis]|nr:MAG: hypothetical protein M1824_004339 [Vezdaea acicularis]